ncbi:restriction endonuclease subunit S [Acinetobacter sp. ANC 4862]|uniref:restriction endonuclease subunit S n=1 Tax=Acinetobacter sp. ANC 4862 TaxID=2529849 RepID=UPI00103A7EC8|nr:restriction endonuclease subunit S [Acinetobacter sp. ANC 4862]TCH61793.1 restriction endonuclease subunit S [Acinetobacter sp. ANC 4862]
MKFVELREVAEFIRGITYKPDELVENFSENSAVCMRTANVQKNLDESNLLSVPTTLIKNDQKYLLEGDILVSTANSWNLVGKCSWVHNLDYKATAGGFIAILRANGEMINPRYLYHWFNSEPIQIQARNCGRQTTNISNMDIDRCLSIKIYLPSLEEQRRIASILDKADEIRQKRQQAIAKLDKLLQATFLNKFSSKNFKPVMVQDLLETEKSMRTGPFGSQLLHSEFVDEGIAVLGIDNAVKNQFQWGKPRFITEQKYKMLSRYTVKPNDVLITIMGTCGRCAVVPEDIPLAINTKHLCCITLDKTKCEPEFLHSYFLMHPTARNYLESRAKGAIMDGLNMGIIKELPVELPPLEDQKAFVKFKKAILSQKQLMDLDAEKIDQMFGSLQQKAFSRTL